jgi:hypothetical protein
MKGKGLAFQRARAAIVSGGDWQACIFQTADRDLLRVPPLLQLKRIERQHPPRLPRCAVGETPVNLSLTLANF